MYFFFLIKTLITGHLKHTKDSVCVCVCLQEIIFTNFEILTFQNQFGVFIWKITGKKILKFWDFEKLKNEQN